MVGDFPGEMTIFVYTTIASYYSSTFLVVQCSIQDKTTVGAFYYTSYDRLCSAESN